jgi:hypothetical protein
MKKRPMERDPVANEKREQIRHAIQRRAYELYLNRGEAPGHALEDWLEAERQIKPLAETKTAKSNYPKI